MIDLQAVVGVVIYLLIVGGVFALLFYLVHFIAREFPSEPMALFAKLARVLLVVLAVLVVIYLLVSLVTPGPMFRWGPHG